ncbi:nicotinamide riboside transporter PnuC [uncultured Piscinibacter sp.]|uniref:nicotinamide riboside transporter PnuC n=1 Tax=uncultured Piscinibacter sp. TaxID=1131835 RepID=UPI0026386576|nr:nicotinamide riboside transporter PnuC [uncultured Piscinibacter sp.]
METLLQALRPLFAPAFTLWGSPATWLELIAFVLALAMVGFNIRVNPWGWPLAIASSLLYFLLFWDSRLYGEASLQIFFAAVALWGWWQWLRGTLDDGTALRVRSLPRRALVGCLLALALAWPALALFLDHRTDSDVPWFDAFPTAASLVGQWLLGRKYVENWPAWLVVNVVSVALFAVKGLWLTVLLYAVFAVLSVAGWRAWRARANAGTP